MTSKASNRSRHLLKITAALAAIGLLGYAIHKHHANTGASVLSLVATRENGEKKPAIILKDNPPASGAPPERVLALTSNTVLASVNGRHLTTEDIFPPGTSNQPVSLTACEFFLQRAIDRELIFQTARSQGLDLDESQKQQLLNFETSRVQTGPGVVHDLNGGTSEISFEMRDAEAFMLQTSLLEKSGASPNVTADQVQAYYQQHTTDFGALPADELARRDAWNAIDFQIREKLATETRLAFQNQLTDYMKQLEVKADIQLTPLTTLASPL